MLLVWCPIAGGSSVSWPPSPSMTACHRLFLLSPFPKGWVDSLCGLEPYSAEANLECKGPSSVLGISKPMVRISSPLLFIEVGSEFTDC